MFCNYLAATALARRRELMFLPMRPVPSAIGHDAWSLARLWLAQFSLRSLFRGGAVCLEVWQFVQRWGNLRTPWPVHGAGRAPKGRNQYDVFFFLTPSLKDLGNILGRNLGPQIHKSL